MDESLYRLISTGLLGLIVLLLLLGVARLGRLPREVKTSATDDDVTPTPVGEPEAVALPASGEAASRAAAPEAESDEEGPYERDGRWWFRRDGELLVYDERKEEWVDPDATADPAAEETPEPEPHPLEEARGWDAAAITEASPAPIPEPVAPPEPIAQPQNVGVEVPQAVPVTTPTTATPTATGGHWKCPTCAVINGSTATSCRMCFSARP